MTMPHLMNCNHQDEGWCLDCVKEMHDSSKMIIKAMRKFMPHVTAKDIAQADTETAKYLEDLRNKYNDQ